MIDIISKLCYLVNCNYLLGHLAKELKLAAQSLRFFEANRTFSSLAQN